MVSMKWLKNVEPTIDDMLSDPIILSMIATRSSPEHVRVLLERVARARRAPEPQPPAAKSDPAC